jgi:hypothetical protein
VKRTYNITTLATPIIRNGHELEDLIHETLWDSFQYDGKKPNMNIIRNAQELIAAAFSEEYDIATDTDGNSYYLVPVPHKEQTR